MYIVQLDRFSWLKQPPAIGLTILLFSGMAMLMGGSFWYVDCAFSEDSCGGAIALGIVGVVLFILASGGLTYYRRHYLYIYEVQSTQTLAFPLTPQDLPEQQPSQVASDARGYEVVL